MAPIAFATHPVPRSGQSTALDDRLVHGFQSKTRKTERLARLASAPSSTQSPSRRRSESVRLLHHKIRVFQQNRRILLKKSEVEQVHKSTRYWVSSADRINCGRKRATRLFQQYRPEAAASRLP